MNIKATEPSLTLTDGDDYELILFGALGHKKDFGLRERKRWKRLTNVLLDTYSEAVDERTTFDTPLGMEHTIAGEDAKFVLKAIRGYVDKILATPEPFSYELQSAALGLDVLDMAKATTTDQT